MSTYGRRPRPEQDCPERAPEAPASGPREGEPRESARRERGPQECRPHERGPREPESAASEPPREPALIVDDLHVSYRVPLAAPPPDRDHRDRRAPAAAAGPSGPSPRPLGALARLLRGGAGGGMRDVPAVRGVSLRAYRGESIGVIGTNGSGKTTLLRAIAGLVPPDRGRVYVRTRPALLGVNPGLLGELTGQRNIFLGCAALGMSPRQVRERLGDVAEFAGLGEALERPLRTYSTGQAQRLRFAVTTTAGHDVLLIDEALAAGDAEFRRRSAERLARLRAEAGTVLLVSHALEQIVESCQRAVWLERGTVVMDGEAGAVVAAYREHEQGRRRRPTAGEETTKRAA